MCVANILCAFGWSIEEVMNKVHTSFTEKPITFNSKKLREQLTSNRLPEGCKHYSHLREKLKS